MIKQTQETKQKLLQAAKAEFLEKGFLSASLRNICKNASVTTGALYFFFKDKEDIFDSIVKDLADGVVSLMVQHLEAEKQMLTKSGGFSSIENPTMENIIEMFGHEKEWGMADHNLVGTRIFDLVYSSYDCAILLLSKSAGTKYEHFADSLIQLSEEHVRKYFVVLCGLLKRKMPDDYCIHWFSHLTVDTYVSLFLHVKSKEQALNDIPVLMDCLHAAFYSLLKNLPELS